MRVRFAARTDVGKTREHNEDNFLVDRKLQLYVVADGMGGHASGEVASAMAVNIVRENIAKNREIIDEFESGEGAVDRRDILALLEHSIQHACFRIFEKGLETPRQRGMGTTVTVLLVAGGRGFLGHVGDSRLYLVRDKHAHQLTEDHSLLNELVKHGKIKNLTDIDHRFKNAVTRAVGVYESVEVDTLDFDMLPGDRFLICSDGLHGYLDNQELLRRVVGEDLEAIAQGLIDFANDQGGRDNITHILLGVEEGEEDDYEDVRLRFETLKQLRLFRYLNYNELVRVMNICRERTFQPGDVLFREGDLEDRLYILLKGEVRIEKSGVEMAHLRPGVHFGEMALVDQTCRSADATTPGGCTLLAIERHDFYDLMRKNSTLAVKMLWSFVKALTERLRNANSELTRLKGLAQEHGGEGQGDGDAWLAGWVDRTPLVDLSPMAPPPVPHDAQMDDGSAAQKNGASSVVRSGSNGGGRDAMPPGLLPMQPIPRPQAPERAATTPTPAQPSDTPSDDLERADRSKS